MVRTTGAPDHPGTDHTLTIELASSIANYLGWARGSQAFGFPARVVRGRLRRFRQGVGGFTCMSRTSPSSFATTEHFSPPNPETAPRMRLIRIFRKTPRFLPSQVPKHVGPMGPRVAYVGAVSGGLGLQLKVHGTPSWREIAPTSRATVSASRPTL